MPIFYKKKPKSSQKRPRKDVRPDVMRAAVKEVIEGGKLRTTATKFDVDKMTDEIRHKVQSSTSRNKVFS